LLPVPGAGREMETRRSARRVSVFLSGARGTSVLTILHPVLGSGAVRHAVPFGLLGAASEIRIFPVSFYSMAAAARLRMRQRTCVARAAGARKAGRHLERTGSGRRLGSSQVNYIAEP
jgi:hypothetical protein